MIAVILILLGFIIFAMNGWTNRTYTKTITAIGDGVIEYVNVSKQTVTLDSGRTIKCNFPRVIPKIGDKVWINEIGDLYYGSPPNKNKSP